jgi:hypothetical protein
MASIPTGNPTACWYSDACVRVASFVTFLSNKEKLDRSPFTKGKEPSPVGRLRKTFFIPFGKIYLFFPITIPAGNAHF